VGGKSTGVPEGKKRGGKDKETMTERSQIS